MKTPSGAYKHLAEVKLELTVQISRETNRAAS